VFSYYFKVHKTKKFASKPKVGENKYLRVKKKKVVSRSVALLIEGACVCLRVCVWQVFSFIWKCIEQRNLHRNQNLEEINTYV
jgi:hypothetical protein